MSGVELPPKGSRATFQALRGAAPPTTFTFTRPKRQPPPLTSAYPNGELLFSFTPTTPTPRTYSPSLHPRTTSHARFPTGIPALHVFPACSWLPFAGQYKSSFGSGNGGCCCCLWISTISTAGARDNAPGGPTRAWTWCSGLLILGD